MGEHAAAGTVVRSADMAEVHRCATTLMNPHAMTVRRRDPGALAEIGRRGGGAIDLLRFAYRSEVEIRPAPLEDFVAVHLPVRGTLRYTCNGRDHIVGPRSAVAISPRDDVRMRWSEDLELRVIRVDLPVVQRRLAALTGRDALPVPVFEPVVAAPRAAVLAHLAAGFGLALDDDTAPGALLARELEDALVATLLLGLAHSATDALRRPAGRAAGAAARAAEYAAAHYAGPIGVGDLARAARVSERTLHAAFAAEFGTSPARWLRGYRLEQARRMMRDDPDLTVTDAATAAGFGHVGRFSAAYRAAFGESPSQTRRRQG